MNDYKPASRPAAFGVAAIAMTALTIGLGVVMPAKIDSSAGVRATAAPQRVSAPAAEAVAAPMRVDVIAVRDAAPVQVRVAAPKRRQQAPGHGGGRAAAAPERVGYGAASAAVPCPYLTNGTVAATS